MQVVFAPSLCDGIGLTHFRSNPQSIMSTEEVIMLRDFELSYQEDSNVSFAGKFT